MIGFPERKGCYKDKILVIREMGIKDGFSESF